MNINNKQRWMLKETWKGGGQYRSYRIDRHVMGIKKKKKDIKKREIYT